MQDRIKELAIKLTICLQNDPHAMSDADLAEMVRKAYNDRLDAMSSAYDRASAKLGTRVVVDGVEYQSKSRAMKATGLTFAALQKRLATPPGDNIKRD